MGRRNNGLFKCPHCGLELDADVNAARNIRRRARGKSEIGPLVRVGAVVTQPELRSNDSTSGAFSATSRRAVENLTRFCWKPLPHERQRVR